ncbi:YjbH domain-containing protein [Desulfocurvibacter africanus]|nr:YjbH domain-containing protein [Desulfocurvibacter africanus]
MLAQSVLVWIVVTFFILDWTAPSQASAQGLFPVSNSAAPDFDENPLAWPSLHGYSGLWDTPSARALPDWRLRLAWSQAYPHRIWSAGLGLFDFLEVHGQLSEVTTREGFPGEPYGTYKDRSFGLKAVLVREDRHLPQIALGFQDIFGTGLFASRYLALSRNVHLGSGDAELHLGLGQGVLGGESFFDDPEEGDDSPRIAGGFHTSSPWRTTRPFGGLSLGLADGLRLHLEYTSLKRDDLFGHDREAGPPLNIGLAWRVADSVTLQAAVLGGREMGLGLAADFPLQAEGLFAWQPPPKIEDREQLRWEAMTADDAGLAAIVTRELASDGFSEVRCRVAAEALWIEAEDERFLSPARSLARMARVALAASPPRTRLLYLNLVSAGRVSQSLASGRQNLADFLDSRIDREAFLHIASLHAGSAEHRREFDAFGPASSADGPRDPWNFALEPKVRAFLNNRGGFLKHKAFLRSAAQWRPWPATLAVGELETVLYNEYDDLRFEPLEDGAVRTDMLSYEQRRGTWASMLAVDQMFSLPADVLGRASAGWFEPAFAGVGAELFRFFQDGQWGLGLEAEAVRKRSLDSQLGLSDDKTLYHSGFVNIYMQLWPEQGLDAGLKLGRFLAGDVGGRLELRRTRNHWTIGVWCSLTDTHRFDSAENREARDIGLFVSLPLALFHDREVSGRFTYAVGNSLTDAGQTVRQPRSLFPLSPDETAHETLRDIEELRR